MQRRRIAPQLCFMAAVAPLRVTVHASRLSDMHALAGLFGGGGRPPPPPPVHARAMAAPARRGAAVDAAMATQIRVVAAARVSSLAFEVIDDSGFAGRCALDLRVDGAAVRYRCVPALAGCRPLPGWNRCGWIGLNAARD